MDKYYLQDAYIYELDKVIESSFLLETLYQKKILITGARGLIGSELIDTIMRANCINNLECTIYAVSRNIEKTTERFESYLDSEWFNLIFADINRDFLPDINQVDYIIHGASNTHPVYYSTKPIETIETNTIGTRNILEYAVKHNCQKFIFLSSVEVYGNNRGDVEKFDETYMGYINSNTLRAGYPESKRLGEALCQAYAKEKNLNIVIPRLARTYGPGILDEDTKAISQFLRNGIEGKDIVLKSKGNQLFSYEYTADAVSGILFLLAKGENGEAYNLTSKESDITLAELAKKIAELTGCKVVFDEPDEAEKKGYSTAVKALLDIEKIEYLGWKSSYSIDEGILKTINLKSGTKLLF